MRLSTIRLLIVFAILAFAASSAFANYVDVTVNTASLNGTDGYLYFQYTPAGGTDSTATITNYTGGVLGTSRASEVDGSAVIGLLPGNVVFANTNGVNDYNQQIAFGGSLDFLVLFGTPAPGGASSGSSTFSLGLYGDEFGAVPLMTSDGTLFTANLMNDGSVNTTLYTGNVSATVPEADGLWVLGMGFLGFAGVRQSRFLVCRM